MLRYNDRDIEIDYRDGFNFIRGRDILDGVYIRDIFGVSEINNSGVELVTQDIPLEEVLGNTSRPKRLYIIKDDTTLLRELLSYKPTLYDSAEDYLRKRDYLKDVLRKLLDTRNGFLFVTTELPFFLADVGYYTATLKVIKSNLPDTKRFVFKPLSEFIDKYLGDKTLPGDRVLCIAGLRDCGKTTLLRQLEESYRDITYFKTYLDNEEYVSLYEDVINSGKRLVLIDEICKASSLSQHKFCYDVRDLQIAGCIVIFTGSSPKVLDSLSASCGRGGYLELPIIMYKEYLEWEGLQANNDTFISYLHFLDDTVNKERYITKLISDTVVSNYNRFGDRYDITLSDISIVVDYLSIKQNEATLRFQPDIQNSGNLLGEISDLLKNISQEFKRLRKSTITNVLKFLQDTGLVQRCCGFTGDTEIEYTGDDILVFAYPWLFTDKLQESYRAQYDKTLNLDYIENIWVEAFIADRLSRAFCRKSIGKIRKSDASREIDLLYANQYEDFNALEVKNSSYNNATRKKNNAEDYSRQLGIVNFTYTCTEIPEGEKPKNCIENYRLVLYLEEVIQRYWVETAILNKVPSRVLTINEYIAKQNTESLKWGLS